MEYVGVKKKQGSIVEVLKDAILSGDIPNGTEMTQNELAQSLGVSRMPVRGGVDSFGISGIELIVCRTIMSK